MIRLERVRVAFGRTVALHDVDLVLFPGVTGLFGPNAAGKSTLLRVLAGLLRPQSGKVYLEDQPISAADEDFRGRVGYVGHDSGLYPRLTVAENVALFATLHGAVGEKAGAALEALGLERWADARAGELSAGLRRRAAVARALVHEPQILLLDEPYANLDDEAAEQVSTAIGEWRRPGRAAVIATHGAKRVKRFADAGIILQRGRVVSYRRRVPEEAQP